MTFNVKKFNLLFFLFLFNGVYSQNTKVAIVTDADSIPILNFYSRTGLSDSIVYIMPNGKKINVNCDIEFKGGLNSLDAFCDSLYYNQKDYNHQELNEMVRFCVILDNNFHIQDIRIYSRLLGYCGKYDYNKFFKRILYKTEGRWNVKTISSKTWHLYIGRHWFY